MRSIKCQKGWIAAFLSRTMERSGVTILITTREKAIKLLQAEQSRSLANVAYELGISRERVRQIAGDIPGASRHRLPKYCKNCGERIVWHPRSYDEGYCPVCWLEESSRRREQRWLETHIRFNCEICGTEFYRTRSEVKYRKKMGIPMPRFCVKGCAEAHGNRRPPYYCKECGRAMTRVVRYICLECDNIKQIEIGKLPKCEVANKQRSGAER